MSQKGSDDFNRADAATLGGSWNANRNALGIFSNTVDVTVTVDDNINCFTAFWPPPNDQYCEATCQGTRMSSMYVGCRLPLGGGVNGRDGYYGGFSFADFGDNLFRIIRYNGAIATTLATSGNSAPVGITEKFRLEVEGPTNNIKLRFYRDGVLDISGTDTVGFGNGYPGLYLQHTTADVSGFDNFAFGSISDEPLGKRGGKGLRPTVHNKGTVTTTSPHTETFSLPPETNLLLALALWQGTETSNTMTWNGVGMTSLHATAHDSFNNSIRLYALVNPDVTAARDLVHTMSANPVSGENIFWLALADANPLFATRAARTRTDASGNGDETGTGPGMTLAECLRHDFIVHAAVLQAGTIVFDAGEVAVFTNNLGGSGFSGGLSWEYADGPNMIVGCTDDTDYAELAVAILPWRVAQVQNMLLRDEPDEGDFHSELKGKNWF